ncbi:hypothetical protein JHK84_035520 [Glycine max]|uniref:40S ribosomal protein S15 n=1 Tax=Glycine max TaxID=3847 RepID=A0A0R0GRI6_SOYBN|nr:hypothetical protein JHK86_035240 [Glycine max]KAG5129123.1 hypothetical protein JHK84_035520 [Glycine max]KAH1099596.1 hypothetical protein GYH30_034981 [Glycine max]
MAVNSNVKPAPNFDKDTHFNAQPYEELLSRKPRALVKKLRKVKREAPASEKPKPVRTHLCNMIIVPEINDSTIGVYHDKTFNQVEIKPEMIGHYFTEFSISYKPVKHECWTVGAGGGVAEEREGMLVTTPTFVSPTLSSGGAKEEIEASTTGVGAKVTSVYGRDTETTKVDKGGGARGL